MHWDQVKPCNRHISSRQDSLVFKEIYVFICDPIRIILYKLSRLVVVVFFYQTIHLPIKRTTRNNTCSVVTRCLFILISPQFGRKHHMAFADALLWTLFIYSFSPLSPMRVCDDDRDYKYAFLYRQCIYEHWMTCFFYLSFSLHIYLWKSIRWIIGIWYLFGIHFSCTNCWLWLVRTTVIEQMSIIFAADIVEHSSSISLLFICFMALYDGKIKKETPMKFWILTSEKKRINNKTKWKAFLVPFEINVQ